MNRRDLKTKQQQNHKPHKINDSTYKYPVGFMKK